MLSSTGKQMQRKNEANKGSHIYPFRPTNITAATPIFKHGARCPELPGCAIAFQSIPMPLFLFFLSPQKSNLESCRMKGVGSPCLAAHASVSQEGEARVSLQSHRNLLPRGGSGSLPRGLSHPPPGQICRKVSAQSQRNRPRGMIIKSHLKTR